jgi:hypothetical protein
VEIAKRPAQRNVLVHLPAGLSLGPQPWSTVNEQSRLLAFAPPSTTIVTIHYRLGPASDAADESDYFPTPVHDVSEGLGFLTSSSSPFNYGHDTKPKICLLGGRLGGGLAAMLALTQPNDVHALTMIEPMVDWVGLDELANQLRALTADPLDDSISTSKKASRRKQRAPLFAGTGNKSVFAAAEELLRLRSRLFKTPSAYFDPFASPILFLRAAGRDTPQDTAGDTLMQEMGMEDVEDKSFRPYDDDCGQSSPGSASSLETEPRNGTARQSPSEETSAGFVSDIDSPEQRSLSPPQRAHPPRQRKVLRRWPAVGRPEDVLLPYSKVFLSPPVSQGVKEATDSLNDHHDVLNPENGLHALFHAQGTEFAELMRRACFYGRESGFANERVKVHEVIASQSSPDLEADSELSVHQDAVLWANEILEED